MNLKILATADLHLGMRFSAYPEVQTKLSEARFQTLNRLVQTANREQCHLLVIAGDLFDRLKTPQEQIVRAVELINEFQGNLAAVLPGNHDYYGGSSGTLWKTFREHIGDRVLVLDSMQSYDLAHYGLKARLYPGPCHSKYSKVDAVSWIAANRKDAFNIGVAHGSIDGVTPDTAGSYFPMRRSELEKLGLDLWIVGHTHTVPQQDSGSLYLPGCPEPDGFDCRHTGQALILELDEGGKINARTVNTGVYRFYREEIDLGRDCEISTVFDRFKTAGFERALLKLAVKGRLSKPDRAVLNTAIEQLGRSAFWARIDDSEVGEEITSGTVEAEFTQGSFPYRLLEKLIEEGDLDTLQAAYDLIQEASR